ncbi:DUF3310 domain-containing protein [Streptomyces sp. ISL-11]|uniref:DUF3310 domain-containing protein n=1 Tax=Streptomyces sp. ISL-11 TaxID=2819174 RepID=UPI00203564FF|nr:DUF3310 domain-containing protein [Streptomyces sp. ISL-11]
MVGDWVRVLPPEAAGPPNAVAELSKNRVGRISAIYSPDSQPYPYDVELNGGSQLCFAERELERADAPAGGLPDEESPVGKHRGDRDQEEAGSAQEPEPGPGQRLLRESGGFHHGTDSAESQAAMKAAFAAVKATATSTGGDNVNSPSHYTSHPSGIECIDITQHLDFLLGNVFKYLWRYGLKPDTNSLQDLKKAAWYLNRKITLEEHNE